MNNNDFSENTHPLPNSSTTDPAGKNPATRENSALPDSFKSTISSTNSTKFPLEIIVIGGGTSSEHDVSLGSADSICGSLNPEKYRIQQLTIGRDGKWYDRAGSAIAGNFAGAINLISQADVVFSALHGSPGEDGTMAALFDMCEVPYVGSGMLAGALAIDKRVTKLLAQEIDLRVARGVSVYWDALTAKNPETETWFEQVKELGLPLIVKPNNGGSSYGVSRVTQWEELRPALDEASRFDKQVLLEEFLVGREIDLAVAEKADGSLIFGATLEIIVGNTGFFDTDNKYDGSADFRIPAEISPSLAQEIQKTSETIFRALGCAGLARVDYILTEDGLVLNEVNTMPGMTDHSQVPRMFAAHNISYSELLDILIENALSRKQLKSND